jgi:hypothetical protein
MSCGADGEVWEALPDKVVNLEGGKETERRGR